MSFARWLKVVSVLLFLGATTSGVGLLAQKATQDTPPEAAANLQTARPDGVLTFAVKPGKLRITVDGRGRLEAANARNGYCMVEGRTTIIRILPEGSAVRKGQIVCELDAASLKDELANQTIVEKTAAAAYENSKLTREAAETAVLEYENGTLPRERTALNGAISLAQSAIHKAEARLVRTRTARKRLNDMQAAKAGSAAPTEIAMSLDFEDRIEDAEQTVLRERLAIELAKTQQDTLEKYTKAKTTKELKADVDRKLSEELAKRANWQLAKSKANKLESQIPRCTLRADIDGVLVYANDPDRPPGRPPQIEEGSTVRERQIIFRLFDVSGPMQVVTKVHESHVDRIRSELKAKVRVDAFANQVFDGVVSEVSPLPDPPTFRNANTKVYTTKVNLDQGLDGLRPGMTAQVEILVSDLGNVLSVPVEAIVQYDNKDHVAVKKADGSLELRPVTLGLSNGRNVEVKQGIVSGEIVVINPLTLLNAEQKRTMKNSPAPAAAAPSDP